MNNLSRFIEQYGLFSKDKKLLVAVSGGLDSMVLLLALTQLRTFGYSNELRVIHINHATRKDHDAEAEFVAKFCRELEVEFICEKLSDLDPNRNFEYKARLARYDAFYKVAREDELIVLAHHLDDSFEWSMLQSLRSSSIEGLTGIPVVNNRVIRPFMCVSKKQITHFAHCFDLPFVEDPTNELMKYERNFIRHQVVAAFKDRYPKYLKHYVFRHNEIARRLGMHQVLKNRTDFQISVGEQSILFYTFAKKSDYSGLEKLLLEGLKTLSPGTRGTIASQLKTVIQAMDNNKTGPVSLVAGIKVYIDHNCALMTKCSASSQKLLYKDYKTFSFEEFSNIVTDYIAQPEHHLDFPFIVLIKGSRIDKRDFKTSFNARPDGEYLAKDVRYYPALKLLREWSKKRNRHKVLRLNYLTSV